jgi:hypothetical protein
MVQGGKEQFKFPSSPAREKCEAHNCAELENFLCRTVIYFLRRHYLQETKLDKGYLLVMLSSQIWSLSTFA